MDKQEWWHQVNLNWNRLQHIVERFAPELHAEAEKARRVEDGMALHRIFSIVWDKAPDSRAIHNITKWGLLCDLCSDFPHAEMDKEEEGDE